MFHLYNEETVIGHHLAGNALAIFRNQQRDKYDEPGLDAMDKWERKIQVRDAIKHPDWIDRDDK